jgi:Ni,Fe-hydrogenase maturation factor
MKVYVFGNEDLGGDMVAITIARKLDGVVEGVEFVFVKPNEDLPFVGEKEVVIMDAVEGVENIEMIEDNELDKINLTKSVSVHDFDLGFQLKYLKKLGKLGKVTIIGLPQEGSDDYLCIQSILRKLVEQEMQGS